MKTMYKLAIGSLIVPAALAGAVSANAQVAGLATANPTFAIGGTKAFQAANAQIETQFKTNLDQIRAKEASRQQLLAQLDKNGDKQVSDDELQAAQTAKSPVLGQLDQLDKDIANLTGPAARAQAYAIEMITQRYEEAQTAVVNAKKINVILSPDAVMYAPDAINVTPAITAELDRIAPTVSTAAPANWQPTRQTVALQQQLQQLAQLRAQYARQQGAAAPAGAPAAAGAKPATKPQPQGR